MKRTKSMVRQDSKEAEELCLYAEGNAELYMSRIQPVIENLTKKYVKGEYDADKAIDACYYVINDANNRYKKDFGHSFSVTERFTASCMLAESICEQILFDSAIQPEDITYLNAIYTGGGIYLVFGKMKNGKYFFGNNDFERVWVYDSCPYKKHPTEDGWFVVEDPKWEEAHRTNRLAPTFSMLSKMICKGISANDKLSNYSPCDFEQYI